MEVEIGFFHVMRSRQPAHKRASIIGGAADGDQPWRHRVSVVLVAAFQLSWTQFKPFLLASRQSACGM
jgi:hypothetical protein